MTTGLLARKGGRIPLCAAPNPTELSLVPLKTLF